MKSKKGKKSGKPYAPDEEDPDPVLMENEEGPKKIDEKRKDRKLAPSKSDGVDEREDDEDEDVDAQVDFSGMKKKKKKKEKGKTTIGFSALLDQEDEEEIDSAEVLADEAEENIDFSSLKKNTSKNKNRKEKDKGKSFGFDSFVEQKEDDGSNPEVVDDLNDADNLGSIDFSGMKKKKKKEKNAPKGFEHLADGEDIDVILASNAIEDQGMNEDELDNIDFSGLKKKKKKKDKETIKSFGNNITSTDFESIAVEVDGLKATTEKVETEMTNILESKGANDDEEMDNVDFSGLKKKKKGKKEKAKGIDNKAADEEDIDAILAQLDGPKNVIQHDSQEPTSSKLHQDSISEVVNETDVTESAASKKKKKKKEKEKEKAKSKQTEDEDIDAILAQLDGEKVEEGVETSQLEVPSKEEVVMEEEEGGVESAAAKKKKKKKEREKAKKDVEPPMEEKQQQETSKGKASDKKVPKHVREMQERLAKQKEAEERIRREEEERRLKEEEEQRRLEELERQKEEAKRRRKEREKEKLLKKKQEGKLLTGKQKEEARRLALMREQLLAQKGLVDGDSVPKEEIATKKPKYENKKKRRPHGGEAISTEAPNVQDQEVPSLSEEAHVEIVVQKEPEIELESVIVEEEPVAEEEEEEEDVDEEEWDAKSWDDDKIELPPVKSAFAEEEEEETKPSSKNISKSSITQASGKLTNHKDASPSVAKPLAKAEPVSNGNESEEDETESEEEESDSEEEETAEIKRRKEAALKRNARRNEALANRSAEDLRSPICCILGHVDTGKTKLLDCIRRTNVQEGEAGGITQQIGATYFPMENIQERTKELESDVEVKLPGLLVIDTPGHESFTNLRSRGSGLCDIAILVVDIMHGLEPQTLESLNLLKMRHTPFVVALNKVDRLYSWKSVLNSPIVKSLQRQTRDVLQEFERRTSQIMAELQEQGLNSELYYKNKDKRKVVSIVPTSAISGEGVPDMLMLLVNLTQKVMKEKLMYMSEVECTVLEVKVIEGLGTTIDVILVNGVLHEGDQIVVCGMQGPIVTTIRALLTPHPMKELRVKGSYQHHKELKAAQGIKLTAQGLEHAIAGTQLHVVGPDDDLEDVKEEAMKDMENVMSRVDKSGEGVCVQASTLGSLEALLEFLKSPAVKIPVSGINIGPVHKRDVMRASVMLERKKKEYATILAFDVKVTPEAKELAEEVGVRIFMADIIYHLFDQFTAYMKNVKEEKRKDVADEAVFPCVLSIKPQCVFNKKDPIILGVDVVEGIAKIGTPLCVPSQDMIDIGRIASMEVNHKVVEVAKKGQAVAMKIVGSTAEETQKMVGRHFDIQDELVSHITRRSIDVLKENFRDELSVEEWKLVVKLKKLFNIP